MQSQIDNWVTSAINMKDKLPNEAIIEVLKPEKNKVTQDILERVVEGYNVKLFIQKKQSGFDMEQSFPIADAKLILPELLKLNKRAGICRSIAAPEFKSKPINYEEDPAEPEFIDPNIVKHAELVIEKYMEKLDQNSPFADELRALYPNNTLLKQGNKRMPHIFTSSHAEFGKIQKLDYEKKKTKKDDDEPPKGDDDIAAYLGTWKRDYDPYLTRLVGSLDTPNIFIDKEQGEVKRPMPLLIDTLLGSMSGATRQPIGLEAILGGLYGNNEDILKRYENETFKLIDNIQTKSMFSSLMNHDPQLKNANPVKMLSVFNTLVTAAPDSAKDYSLVKSVLRSANAMGESVIDPTTLTQLYKMQKEYRAKNMDAKLKSMMHKITPEED